MISGNVCLGNARVEFARWEGTRSERLPILLLHEGLGSIALWREFPQALASATGREVIAWSRRGHGGSDALPDRHEPDYMHEEARLLPALQDALGIGKAHWFGHSDGGSIALIGAAWYPDLAASLVLEAPHVFVEDLTVASIAEIGKAFAGSDMRSRMNRYHADPDHTFGKWHQIWLDPAFRDWNIEALLPSIEAPALLIQGRDDQYGTMAQLDCIEAVLPETVRLELDSCGHSPHRDQESSVIAAVRDFLKGEA